MAKRMAPTQQKMFSFDLESLLISEFSQEEHNDSQTFGSELFNHPKKLKTKSAKQVPDNTVTEVSDEPEVQPKGEEEETDGEGDVSKFFETIGNDFSKSMQSRKSKLGHFAETVISVCQSKFTDLLKKQGAELEEFKEQTMTNIETELNKFEEEFKNLKQHESKLLKIFEQQLKIVQKAAATQAEWVENFRKLHKNFIQVFEEIKTKHRNETLEFQKSIEAEMCELQNKFLADFKKEEVQTMKKYLSSVYF